MSSEEMSTMEWKDVKRYPAPDVRLLWWSETFGIVFGRLDEPQGYSHWMNIIVPDK